MKLNRKVIESAAVLVFALAIVVTAVTAENANTNGAQYTKEADTEELLSEVATKEKTEIGVVAATEMAEQQNAEETADSEQAAPEEAVAEEVSEWANKLMPNVEEYLNIRAESSAEAALVGKLYKGAEADILEHGEEWTKISSGSVTGYVKNEFCVFGAEAEAMAKAQGTVYATALTGGLRVRAEASATEGTSIVHVLEEGKRLKVDTAATAPEGWIAVICFDKTAYVSAEYVSVELELGKAISIEEEQAAIRKAEQEKAAAQSRKAAVSATHDELTLLAALIQCEAGGECYEGQVAVGAVVMNRLRSGYAGSISGVIYANGQFTPVASGALARRLSMGVSSSCLKAAQEAINGLDNVGGARNFRRADSGQSGIVIGNHVFF